MPLLIYWKGEWILKSKDRLLKVLSVLATVIIVVFFASQIYSLSTKAFLTQIAYEQTVLDTIDAKMFVIREETVLTVPTNGVTVPLADNAERVSKGSTIAAVFSNEEAAENYVKIQSLEKKLAAYQKIDGQLRLSNVDLDKLTDEINSDFKEIIDCSYNNNFEGLSDVKLSFSEKISRKQISLDEDVDCAAKISQLQNEISSLLSNSVPTQIITAEASGYYVNKEDGFENLISVEHIDELTAEQLNKAFESEKKEPTSGSIGKIIDGYNWYIAAVIDSTAASSFKKGKSVSLIFGDSDEDAVSTYLHSVKKVNDKESLIIFRCTLMNDELVSLRKINGKIVVNDFTGLKVNRDAVRIDENGNTGVYVRRGNIVNFRSLNIIYSEESFVVASKPGENSDIDLPYTHLKQYDEVIISGKELKDGMVIG